MPQSSWNTAIVILSSSAYSVFSLPSECLSSVVDDESLFLAPSSISRGFYNGAKLPDIGTVEYSADDLSFDRITGVKILPLLGPNPKSSDGIGSYTPSELESISIENYEKFFHYLPNIDYSASLTELSISIDYQARGNYFVAVQGERGGVEVQQVFHDQVGDNYFSEEERLEVGPEQVTEIPKADIIILSNDDDTAHDDAETVLKANKRTYTKVNSLDEARREISALSEKLGRKVRVVFIGHGNKGSVKVGDDYIRDSSYDDSTKDNNETPDEFAKSIAALAEEVLFFSCQTGSGVAGKNFMKEFQRYIPYSYAFDTNVDVFAPWRSLWQNNGFFTRDAGWFWGTSTVHFSEPIPLTSSIIFHLSALVGICSVVATRCNKKNSRPSSDVHT